jgi:adenine phosphoribosyltransferase
MPSDAIKTRIRTVRDWPKPGVNFRDIAPLFYDPAAFRATIADLADFARQRTAQRLAAIDARGFILGGALARELDLPLLLVRKKGKLPGPTRSLDYALEYGHATLEVQVDACQPGERVWIVDDLVASGGTLGAAVQLLRELGGQVVGVGAVVDLPDLGGAAALRAQGVCVDTLCAFHEAE